jgi:hypothetical protein
MADSKSIKLTAKEIQTLADRLTSRGVSRVLDDQPEMQRDMRIAARVIRTLLHEVDRVAAICSDAAHLLRNLSVEVEG